MLTNKTLKELLPIWKHGILGKFEKYYWKDSARLTFFQTPVQVCIVDLLLIIL